MEAKDLMIGDWLLDGNVYAQVTSITCDGNIETTRNALSNIELVEPVPLTSEILKKNGFTKSTPPPGIHARCHNLDNKEEKYHLTIANYNKYKRLLLNVDSVDSECFNIRCDYVHELQHALRICGIEKEIVL
jgi:hypothetical protein